MESIEIQGRSFPIERISSLNKNASARMKEGRIVISIPSRWPAKEKDDTYSDLLRRAIRSIEKGRWRTERGKIIFFHGQRISVMGNEMTIAFIPSARFGSMIDKDRLEVKVVEDHPQKDMIGSKLAAKKIIKSFLPSVIERIKLINEENFHSKIEKVLLRDNSSRWGSCSRRGSISLNLRLLFMPQDILDYVIVHELAHTKYMSHGPRFWALVERAVPDHIQKRRWLRENGWKIPGTIDISKAKLRGGEETARKALEDFYEEQY